MRLRYLFVEEPDGEVKIDFTSRKPPGKPRAKAFAGVTVKLELTPGELRIQVIGDIDPDTPILMDEVIEIPKL
jgi:hypothetical protein